MSIYNYNLQSDFQTINIISTPRIIIIIIIIIPGLGEKDDPWAYNGQRPYLMNPYMHRNVLSVVVHVCMIACGAWADFLVPLFCHQNVRIVL